MACGMIPAEELKHGICAADTLFSAKLELKTEPVELVFPESPIPDPPQEDIEAAQDDESDIYAEFLQLSEMFRAAFVERIHEQAMGMLQPRLLSICAAPEGNATSTSEPLRQRSRRSGELVRASCLSMAEERHFRELVRRTRILYESLRVYFAHEEERRWTGEAASSSNPAPRRRAALNAAAAMVERGLWLNRDKRIVGSVPGVYVGDQFFFRMELCTIGLHGHLQAGIDYVGGSRTPTREPIATSIIVSGGYEDDEDNGDVLIYTGHGGKNRSGVHAVDQKLEGGNLALERSLHHGIEIRVIRGRKSDRSPTGRVYIYDGLYRITHFWFSVGKSGFGVYKYKLVRLPDQPEMGTVYFRFAEELKTRPLVLRPAGYLSLDLSKGKEKQPVYLFNDVDDDSGPLDFAYTIVPVYPPSGFSGVAAGCGCTLTCSDGCFCIKRNGGEMVYDSNGLLLKGRAVIYECGASCRCPPSCSNRVTQKGLNSRLEVFRSRETGWGVRSLDMIRAGEFICEYTGLVLTSHLATVFSMNGSSLIYPDRFPPRWMEWGEISHVFPGLLHPQHPSPPPLKFALDVSRMRNVACYFSHSCAPNVMVQFVLYDHPTAIYPHLMLFAMENIPPLRELSLDYGITTEWTSEILPVDIK